MIHFKRNDNKVIIEIEHGIFPLDKGYFTRELEQTHPYQAELLRKAFQENLNKHLEHIKREYYNRGWKDCQRKGIKAKDRKKTEFFGGWEQ